MMPDHETSRPKTTTPADDFYIACYLQGDFDLMSKLMDATFSYDQPNDGLLSGDPKCCSEIQGIESSMQEMKKYREKMENVRYEVRSKFLTNETAYFDILVHYEQCGKYIYGASHNFRYKITLPVNIVITLRNGRIIRHQDYFDYSVIYKQIQLQEQDGEQSECD